MMSTLGPLFHKRTMWSRSGAKGLRSSDVGLGTNLASVGARGPVSSGKRSRSGVLSNTGMAWCACARGDLARASEGCSLAESSALASAACGKAVQLD